MSSYWTDFWADVHGAILAAWPEFVPDDKVIFRINQAERLNWNNLVEEFQRTQAAGLQLPYAVVQIGATQRADWGLKNSVKTVPVTVYYVSDTEDTDDVAGRCEGKAYDLVRTFETAEFQTVQCVEEATSDVSDANGMNGYFLASNMPLYSAAVTVNLIVGEAYSVPDSIGGDFGASL